MVSAAHGPALQEAFGTKDVDSKPFTEGAKNNCPRGLGRSQHKRRVKPTEGVQPGQARASGLAALA